MAENKPIKHPTLPFDDEDWDKLETLSALGYSNEKIATYFGVDKIIFKQIAADKNSMLAERLEAGKLKQDIDERLALYHVASTGDVPAQKQIHEIKRSRAFKISKMDIFGTFEHQRILERLNDYIQAGKAIKDISVEEQLYIDSLIFIRDMDSIYGRRATVDFFVKNFKLKHQRASEMYDEAVNLFYGDRNINKTALRHKFAERLEMASNVVMANAETSRDWEVFGILTKQASFLLELDKPNVDKLPKELYMPTTRVFSLNTEAVKMIPINRNELASEIDGLDQPESVKSNLRQDAMIEPINLSAKFDIIESEFKK